MGHSPIRYPDAVWEEDDQRWISDAEVAEVPFTALGSQRARDGIDGRLIVRRVKRLNPASVPAGQHELFTAHRHHAVFTDSPLTLLQAEAGHRQHAITEQVIADLKERPARAPALGQVQRQRRLTLATIAFNLLRATGALTSLFHARATPPPRPCERT